MRRVLGLLAVIGLVAAISPATVSAAAPFRASSTQSGILCEFATEAGDVLLQWQSFDGEMFASVLMWAPEAGPDDAPSIGTFGGTVSVDGTTIEARFELGTIPSDESEPQPAGTGRMTATLTEAAPEEPFDSRLIRDGNRRITLEQFTQLLAVTGSLTIDLLDGTSITRSLDGCGAGTFRQTMFATNPNAHLTATEQLFVSCSWAIEGGSVGLLAIVDDFDVLTQVVVQEGDRVAISFAEPMLTEDAFGATYELFDPTSGTTVGSGVADADLAGSGERITDVEWVDPHRTSVIGERLSVDGTLSVNVDGVATELVMDDEACTAGDVRIQVMEKMPRD